MTDREHLEKIFTNFITEIGNDFIEIKTSYNIDTLVFIFNKTGKLIQIF